MPRPIRAASEWAWRLLLISGALFVLGLIIRRLSEVVIPLAVAILLAALLQPLTNRLDRVLPRSLASLLTVIGLLTLLGLMVSLVVSQFSDGFGELTSDLTLGLTKVRNWVLSTFHITDAQFSHYYDSVKSKVGGANVAATAAHVGLTASHLVTGLLIALFALFFFLYDGAKIWAWVVQLFPRDVRHHVASSGHIAWSQLGAFTRATIVVAAVDSIGITIGAAVLRIPFLAAVGLLVFVGAFIPIVGAVVSGGVAVILALVARGPVLALAMLGVVILVMQLEAHVLQPWLLGSAVRVHPLAVIVAIAVGLSVAGIAGALVAVPLAAVTNALGHHLIAGDWVPPAEDGVLDPEPAPPAAPE